LRWRFRFEPHARTWQAARAAGVPVGRKDGRVRMKGHTKCRGR
jgi:hypothetical protein